MASIKKKNGKWEVRYDVGFDSQGKRIQKYKGGFLLQKDAETFLTSTQHSINQSNYIEPDKMFLFEYLNRWLESERHRLSPPSYAGYEVNIRCHINPIIGGIKLQELKAFHVKDLYAQLQRNRAVIIDSKKRNLKRLSAKSIMYVHRVLSKSLEDALHDEIINRNPAKAVVPPKLQKHKAQYLDTNQIKLMLEALKEDEMYIPIYLSVVLGLRRGEVLGLRWKNIDFDKKKILICEELTMYQGKPIFLTNVKTDGSNREIFVTDRIVEILRQHKLMQKKKKVSQGTNFITEMPCQHSDGTEITEKTLSTMEFACAWNDGSLFNPSHVSRAFKERMKKHGLPEIKFHELRHSNGALMIAQNVHLKGASERLGHSTITITNDLYGHVEKSVQEQIAETIDNAIFGAK